MRRNLNGNVFRHSELLLVSTYNGIGHDNSLSIKIIGLICVRNIIYIINLPYFNVIMNSFVCLLSLTTVIYTHVRIWLTC